MQYQFDSFGNLKTKTVQELAATEDSSDAIIVLDRGITGDSKPYWAYIAIRPSRYAEYMRKASAHETTVFSNYGTILQYGFDKEVPADVKNKMKQQHNFDENFRENLVKNIRQARDIFLKQWNNRASDIANMLKSKNTDY